MPDAFQMKPDPAATLIGRMTNQAPQAGPQFSPAQLATFMELAMPKLCTETPGFPEGMTCEVERDEDGNGWHFHVRRLSPNG